MRRRGGNAIDLTGRFHDTSRGSCPPLRFGPPEFTTGMPPPDRPWGLAKSMTDTAQLRDYCSDVAHRAADAARTLATLAGAQKNLWLTESAAALRRGTARLQAANLQDLAAAPGFGLTDAQIDRLKLTPEGIEAIAQGLCDIAALPDPVGETIEAAVRPNGLEVAKVRVPLGVVFFIYESRPNVTADAAAICLKSGNAVILRGGKEAAHSSHAILEVLREVAQQVGVPVDAMQLVATPDREAVGYFLRLPQYIDVAIPRGGEGLIRRVVAEAEMPVIKHYDGNCHVYVDASADLDMAVALTENAKCQRMGVCNACESLLVHADIAQQFLPRIDQALGRHGVELRGDSATRTLVARAKTATEEDYRTEFLGPVLSVKIVPSLDAAIEHINRYGSHHTDAIVTQSLLAARRFAAAVDSSAVMINASTRFNDGGQFGLGAEIGISTDKFHARGPCGLRELTSYKYVVYGNGQLRQ
jgi:glutamate-5-semialdehyde dehydrogenase